jgi:hypothetical protein
MSDLPDCGIAGGYYDNARRLVVLQCLCGEQCCGEDWEEAGAELDEHLDYETPWDQK